MQAQKTQLPRRLHPLRHNLQIHALRQSQDGAHDGGVVRVLQHIAHKTLIDLDLIQRQALEKAQAGIARAEIVQGKANALTLELLHAANGILDVA